MFKKIWIVLAGSLLLTGPAQAAYDVFLKIDGIPGTSTAQGFQGYIDVYSFSLGFARGSCSSLNVMKKMDAASSDMTVATLLGTMFPTAIVALRNPGEGPFVFMRLTLNNVVLTSVQESGSTGGDDRPTESVSIQPSSVKIEAYEQDQFGTVTLVATNTVTCQKMK